LFCFFFFFFSSRRRHTRFSRDWSSDVCSSDLFFKFYLLILFYELFKHFSYPQPMKFKSLFLAFCLVILCCNCSKDDDKTAPTNPPSGGPQFPCENGMAGIFPCEGYDLMAHIDLKTFGSNSGSDCWGWTDPSTGKEYAIVGLDDGTAFVDISQASNPIYLGKLPTVNFPSAWRDIKTYQHYAFIV